METLDYSQSEVHLCLSLATKNLEILEMYYGDIEETLGSKNLLIYDQVIVYGIPTYKKGLDDTITKFLFNEYEILQKQRENVSLKKLIYGV